MSRFEFIFVLISIVAGLALTRLLSGLTQSLRPSERGVDIAHVLFSLAIITLLFGIWWNSFRWEEREVWTYIEYSLLCIYMSIFYAASAILHPLNSPVVPRFNEIRTQFYVVLVLYTLVEILVVYIRDNHFLTMDYWVLVVHIIVLAGIGIFVRNRRFDQLFAGWYLFVNVAWQIFARMLG